MRTIKLAAVFLIAVIFCAFFVQTGLAGPAPNEEVRYFKSGDVISRGTPDSKTGSGDKYTAGDVIVVLRPNASKSSKSSYASSVAAEAGVKVANIYEGLSSSGRGVFAHFKVKEGTEKDAIAKLKTLPDVAGVQLNYTYTISGVTPDDTKYNSLWGMPAIKAPEAWEFETGSSKVYAAVIDSGIDYTHPEIKDNFEMNGYSGNFSYGTEEGDYSDENGHGTHVAGTIGAIGNNGMGVAGVNWNTKLISLRIFNASGSCGTDEILGALSALLELLNNDPTLKIASVNMSYGRSPVYQDPDTLLDTPEYLAYKALSDTNRIVLCVAAGNDGMEIGKGAYSYPASFIGLDNMIVVANAQNDSSYSQSWSSNYSTEFVDIAAPGTSILSTAPQESRLNDLYPESVETENGYKYLTISGTSMATPHVAGAVALLASAYPEADAPALKDAVLRGANPDYAKDYTVNGFLDVNKSLSILEETYGTDVPPEITVTSLKKGYLTESYDVIIPARGARPITWTKVSGTVPPGLNFEDGRVWGTPTASGSYKFKVKAANANGSDTKEISIVISDGTPEIITTELPDGSIREIYSSALSAKGLAPITWSLNSGSLPPYFTLSADGTITGAPSKPGTWTFTVKAQNSAGSSTQKVTLTIKGIKPVILNLDYLKCAELGKYYENKMEAIGTGPITWTKISGNLPNGLSLSSSGLLSGTPAKAGYYSFQIQAENAYGKYTNWHYMYVDDMSTDSGITILTQELPHCPNNVNYNVQLEATGTGPIKWTLEDGYLPDGLTFNEDGTISGKKNNYSSSSRFLKVKASNSKGSVSKHFVFWYSGNSYAYTSIITESLPDAVKGESYSRSIYAVNWPSYFDIAEGELPPGLVLSSGGYISGTPVKTGTYKFTVRAGDSTWDMYDRKELTITVRDSAVKPTIKTTSLPDGIIGVPYDKGLSFTGTDYISWSYSGTLPPGFYTGYYGIVRGTPTQTGEYNFTLTASNSAGSDTKSYRIKINSQPVKPEISTATLKNGLITVSYDAVIQASGTCPVTWSVYSGSLPEGLSLSSVSTSKPEARITGIPKKEGTYEFTVRASNAAGSDTQTYTLEVEKYSSGTPIAPIIITDPELQNATLNKHYSVTLKAWGTESITWTKTSGTIPKGLTLNKTTSILSGTPTKSGTFTFTVKASNTVGSDSRQFTLTVYKAPAITTTALKDASVGEDYYFTLTATGTQPITWSVMGLPDGLKCDDDGNISGNPSKAGTYELFIEALNGADTQAEKTLTLNVREPVTIDAKNFPDSVFREYVKNFDSNGDGKLSLLELAAVQSISVGSQNINTLKGLEYFTEITYLYCPYNNLTELDVSKNTKLESLSCYSNQLTNLDVSKCTALTSLNCYSNKLTALNISGNTDLLSLSCYSNQLTELDVSRNIDLTSLTCYSNQLTELDVSKCDALTYLSCSNNKLTSLNVTGNAALTTLYCYNNQLTALNVTKNAALTNLSCYTNQLTKLNVTKNAALTYLDCDYNQLTTLDLTKNVALRSLYCYYNQLAALNLSKNRVLTSAYMYGQKREDLKIIKNSDNLYYVNLGEISGAKGNVSSVSGSSTAKYDSSTGMATFEFLPSYVSYKYNTKAKRLSDKYISVELRTSDKPVVVSGYVSDGKAGNEYEFTLEATGKTPLTWHIENSDLPAGLSLDQITGKISGNPTVTGKFEFTVKAENSEGSDSKKLSMNITAVKPKILTAATLPAGKTGNDYSAQLEASGTQPVTWTLSSGSLPDGLSLSKEGLISGVPTKKGTFSFKVKAKNTAGSTSKTFKITIKNRISVSGKFQTPGYLRVEYYSSIIADGGKIPYTVQLASGTLPKGLELSASGNEIVLSGTPTKNGTYKFKINITDSDGYTLTTGQYTVKITSPSIKGSLSGIKVGEYVSLSLNASGGTAPYTWKKYSGTLPAKLNMIQKEDGKILEISGTTTKAGTYTFKLKLTDSNGSYVTKSFTITVGSAVKTETRGNDSESAIEISDEADEKDNAEEKESLQDNVPDNAVKKETLAYSEANGTALFRTSLSVSDDDILISHEGKDSDLVSVKAYEPLTFILGKWVNAEGDSIEVYDAKVFVDDNPAAGIEISEGKFTLPAEMIHDDFKVCVKAKTGDSEIESEEVFISAEN